MSQPADAHGTLPPQAVPPQATHSQVVPPQHVPHPGDGWVECTCGRRHWGLHGAAGLLLARRAPDGTVAAVVLQHRALWSDQGGTWGVPGGARGPEESAEQAALREAAEEGGIDPTAVAVRGSHVLDHGPWSYTTVLADAVGPVDPEPTDAESLEVRWVDADEVATLPLLPAFAEAWPGLRRRLDEYGPVPGGPVG